MNEERPDVVFIGPSIPQSRARELLPEAVFLPPASMGDVLSVVTSYRPHSISIIDGTFLSTMSVFHKEILYALQQGIWVLGASSMGALRAAECHRYGMIGVGSIFERLVSGDIVDDDEVALTHGDEESGFRAVTDAFVTIRATVEAMVVEGSLSQGVAEMILAEQKARWFPDRRLSDILTQAAAMGTAPAALNAMRDCLRRHDHDPKRADAEALLLRVRELPPGQIPLDERIDLNFSGQFRATLARDVMTRTADGMSVSLDDIRAYALLHEDDYDEVMDTVRADIVLAVLGLRFGGPATDDELRWALDDTAQHFGVEAEDLEAHLATLDLTGRNFAEFIGRRAMRRRMVNSYFGHVPMGGITSMYLDHLRLTGRYETVKHAAALQHAMAQDVTFTPQPDRATVLATFCSIRGWDWEDWTEWCVVNDLNSVDDLVYAAELAVRAHHAMFGTGLVTPHDPGAERELAEEPLMSRGR